MNAKKLACAPKDIDIHELWSKIDWNKCECFVQKPASTYCKGSEGRQTQQGQSLAMDAYPLVLRQSIGCKTSYD